MTWRTAKRPTSASILVGLLWCLAILSVVVVAVLHASRTDLQVVKNYGDRIQAHYLAVAGVEKAKALVYRSAKERSRNGINHSGDLYNAADQFREVQFGRGKFSVLRRGRADEGGGVIYGIGDEESRLNVNTASQQQLANLYSITPDVVAAIVDWRDSDHNVTTNGAEADYYMSLQPPYLPRDGAIQTIRELLMVRGISRDSLLGRDVHLNGLLSGTPEDWAGENVGDNRDLGWAFLLTTDSTVDNVSATGADRVDVQSADETALTGVKGITPDIAKAIVAYRGQNRFQNLADLLDVVAPRTQSQNQANQATQTRPVGTPFPNANVNPNPNPNPIRNQNQSEDANANLNPQSGQGNNPGNTSGPKVISENLLMDIADELTVGSALDSGGAINVNTACLEVLICLPGVSRELAQGIISYRQSSGFLPNIAHLLKVPGMTRDIFKQVAPLVSARSETFRILCEGQVTSTGTRQRIQETVHIGLNSITTLSYREDDL